MTVSPIDLAVQVSEAIAEEFEGFKLVAYWDKYGGCWTIGFGATGKGITQGVTWTKEYAYADLRQRLNKAHNQALTFSTSLISAKPDQQDAITDIIYNEGLGTYLNSHILKPAIDGGDWAAAAEEIKNFDHAGGKVLPGLQRRRQLEAVMLLS